MIAHAALLAVLAVPAPALPAPFDRFTEDDIVQLAYPGQATHPAVHLTSLWKGEGTPRLLAVFDKTGGSYEVAMFGLAGGKLATIARFVEPDYWLDCVGFDLAPYRVAPGRMALGVRYQIGGGPGGAGSDVLKLYLRNGATLQPIFERRVYWRAMETDDSLAATIQLAPGKGEYKDLIVVETAGTKTARERWTWDAAAHAYKEAPAVK